MGGAIMTPPTEEFYERYARRYPDSLLGEYPLGALYPEELSRLAKMADHFGNIALLDEIAQTAFDRALVSNPDIQDAQVYANVEAMISNLDFQVSRQQG